MKEQWLQKDNFLPSEQLEQARKVKKDQNFWLLMSLDKCQWEMEPATEADVRLRI